MVSPKGLFDVGVVVWNQTRTKVANIAKMEILYNEAQKRSCCGGSGAGRTTVGGTLS